VLTQSQTLGFNSAVISTPGTKGFSVAVDELLLMLVVKNLDTADKHKLWNHFAAIEKADGRLATQMKPLGKLMTR